MSQEASTNLIIPESSEELITNEPWTIETYADGFMDDLFADIDSILDGNTNLPAYTVQQGYTQLQKVSVPQIVLPNTSLQNIQTVSYVVNNPAVVRKVVKKPRPKSRHWFSSLLSVATTLGLAIAGIVWVMNSGLLNRPALKSFQQALEIPQPKSLTKAEVEADFVNYMLGALTAIDRQEAKNNNKPANVALTPEVITNRTALAYVRSDKPSGNLPPVLTANNTSPASNPSRSTNIVERIYIPVYKAPLPMRYVPPKVAGIATTLPSLPSVITETPTNTSKPASVFKPSYKSGTKPNKPANVLAVVQQNLKPINIKTTAIAIKQSPKPAVQSLPTLLAPPKLPTATPSQPQSAPAKQEVVSIASASTPSHTLEGLLELGNKSAALFQMNGVTQRIDIGETIGSSGWTLVDVANGEAIIRRNGEVRSIFTGQKF